MIIKNLNINLKKGFNFYTFLYMKLKKNIFLFFNGHYYKDIAYKFE